MVSRADDLKFRNDLAAAVGNDDLADRILERMPMTPADNLATKDDLAHLRGELLEKFGELRGEFGELRGEFSGLRGEVRGELADLRTEIADKMRVQTWYLTGTMLTGIGLTAAVVAALGG